MKLVKPAAWRSPSSASKQVNQSSGGLPHENQRPNRRLLSFPHEGQAPMCKPGSPDKRLIGFARRAITFTPDGRRVLAGGIQGVFELYDLATADPVWMTNTDRNR